MAGTLTVQNLQGPSSGANANTVLIPSGQTLYAPGHVLQTVQGSLNSSDNGGFFLTTTSYTFTSAVLNASITPSSSNSKILITVMCQTYGDGACTVYRGGTRLGDSNYGFGRFQYGSNGWKNQNYVYLDSPSTTSSVTYTLYGKSTAGGTVYIGGDLSIPNTITLMEIAQ